MITNDMVRVSKQTIQERHVKIELLDTNENVLDEIQGNVLSGNLNISDSSIRRTINLSLALTDKSFLPSSTGKIGMNKRIRVYVGTRDLVAEEIVWINLGIFLLSEPNINYGMDTMELSIKCIDKMSLLDGTFSGYLKASGTKILANTPIFDAIKATVGMHGENKIIVNDVDNMKIPYDLEFKTSNTIYDVIKTISELYMGYEFYYDINGYFIYQKIKDRKNDMAIYEFMNGELVVSESYKKDWNNIRNSIVVWGRLNKDGIQVTSTLKNENSNHPYCVQNIGERIFTVDDTKLQTQEQSDMRCRYELDLHSNDMESVSLNGIPLYFLDVNNVISIINEELNVKDKYIIKSISLPFETDGQMSIQANKIFYY